MKLFQQTRRVFLLLSILLISAISTTALQAQDFSRTRPDRLGFDRDRLAQLDTVLQSYI
ncbi:MAG: hypothetical protein ACI934_001466, partial [Pseudohongiellaceae bacterium]